MQGGWRGGKSGSVAQSPMHLALSLAATEEQLAAVRQQAAEAQGLLDSTELQQRQRQEHQAAAEEAAAELAAAEQAASSCQLQLESQRAAQASAEAALARSQAELSAKWQLLTSIAGNGSRGGDIASALAAVAQEQQRLAAACAALQASAATTADQLAAAAERQAAVEGELALMQPDSFEALLQAKCGELPAAAAAVQAKQAELAAQLEHVAARQQAVEAAGGSLRSAEEALAAAEAEVAAQQAAAEQLAEEQRVLQEQLSALLREVPELEGALATTAGGSGSEGMPPGSGASAAGLRKQCAQLARQRAKVHEERQRSATARMPLSEQLRYREQKASLAAVRQQAATLQAGAQRLQEGIAGSNAQVGGGLSNAAVRLHKGRTSCWRKGGGCVLKCLTACHWHLHARAGCRCWPQTRRCLAASMPHSSR